MLTVPEPAHEFKRKDRKPHNRQQQADPVTCRSVRYLVGDMYLHGATGRERPRMKTGSGWVELNAGQLRIRVSEDGRICCLRNAARGKNYCHSVQPAFLVTAQFVGDPGRVVPVKLQCRKLSASRCRLAFTFQTGPIVVLEATEHSNYLRLKVIKLSHPDVIQCLYWGPMATSMEGPIGEYVGLLRQGTFVIGMLGLDMNTDGHGDGHDLSARRYPQTEGGSWLELETWDWRRDGRTEDFFGIRMDGRGVHGVGIVGSGVVLYGCAESRVLDTIEAVEQAESLPHPMIEGRWAKRSPVPWGSSWWTDYTEENIDRCLDLAVASGFKWLCRFRTFGNWGHFDPDPNLYPTGFAGFKGCSDKAKARGVHTLFYTLSTFTKEINLPEPCISPVPDRRLQTVPPETRLARALGRNDTAVRLEDRDGLLGALRQPHMDVKEKAIWVDDELIQYEHVESEGGHVVLTECKRGFYRTVPAVHPAGRRAVRVLYTYWQCFFPGTEAMNAELGRRVGWLARKGNFRQVTLDGHEGCRFTGHGAYSQNVFLDAIYRETHDKDFLYTGSNLGNWSWHALSYISWGEYDCHKGFRGGMLDYRLWRMIQLRNNYMPRRLGQHYPDKHTTVEDVEWLMGLAAGWDAGVELHVEIDNFNQNPKRDLIVEKIRMWEVARLAGAFSERQKLGLRQSDCIHTLSRTTRGGWRLEFVRRWRHLLLQMTPAASVPIRSLGDGSVKPCSVLFDWTHDPGIYQSAWLSDDLVHGGGKQPGCWEFTPPEYDRGERVAWDTQKLQILVRLPKTAAGPIRHPRVIVNGDPELQVRVPVVLQPGQYLSTPHDMPMAFVYDANHEVVKEVPIRNLPALPTGPLTVEFAFDGGAGKGPGPILNLRTHRHIPLKP